MSYEFKQSDTIPASPKAIYDAWLDSRGHTAMTGAPATASEQVGGGFTAWDGYIRGQNLELKSGKLIVQSWRTTDFTEDQEDSRITVSLAPVKGGTSVTLTHSNVPDDHKGYENGGWRDHYFEPMKKYFGKLGTKKSASSQPKRAQPKSGKAKTKTATPKTTKAKSKKTKAVKRTAAKRKSSSRRKK
jgi:activator of HSP90 ATPase